MDSFTAKNFNINKAPKLIQLLGDKTKKSESSQHIIEFPGGAIEVSRTSEGLYWAHIILNTRQAYGDNEGLKSKLGRVVDSRFSAGGGIEFLAQGDNIEQIAVLIEAYK